MKKGDRVLVLKKQGDKYAVSMDEIDSESNGKLLLKGSKRKFKLNGWHESESKNVRLPSEAIVKMSPDFENKLFGGAFARSSIVSMNTIAVASILKLK